MTGWRFLLGYEAKEETYMSTSHFYHTQGIRGFKLKRMERIGGVEIACVESSAHRVACPGCGGWDTSIGGRTAHGSEPTR